MLMLIAFSFVGFTFLTWFETHTIKQYAAMVALMDSRIEHHGHDIRVVTPAEQRATELAGMAALGIVDTTIYL
jgi:hypothetical protein